MKRKLIYLFLIVLIGGLAYACNTAPTVNPSRETAEIKKRLDTAKAEKDKYEALYNEASEKFRIIDIENYKNCLEVEAYNLREKGEWWEERYNTCREYLKIEYGLSEEEIGYYNPSDLFYTFLDSAYQTQGYQEHYNRNGLLAIDIGTGGKPLTQYAPDLYNKEQEWTVGYCDFPDSLGKCLELFTDTDKFKIGHIREYLVEDGQKVKTGTPIATTGGTEQDEGASTGYHAHIEYYTYNKTKEDWIISEYKIEQSDRHKAGVFTHKPKPTGDHIFTVTSYNAEEGQTDNTPCIAGGTGYDICDMARDGKRPLALSQEWIDWSVSVESRHDAFSKGDIVRMESIEGTAGHGDPRCNGEFIVSDAMNPRYTNRADIFFLDRADNISCTAKIYKI